MDHMKGKKRKGPQPIDGRILKERERTAELFIINIIFVIFCSILPRISNDIFVDAI